MVDASNENGIIFQCYITALILALVQHQFSIVSFFLNCIWKVFCLIEFYFVNSWAPNEWADRNWTEFLFKTNSKFADVNLWHEFYRNDLYYIMYYIYLFVTHTSYIRLTWTTNSIIFQFWMLSIQNTIDTWTLFDEVLSKLTVKWHMKWHIW